MSASSTRVALAAVMLLWLLACKRPGKEEQILPAPLHKPMSVANARRRTISPAALASAVAGARKEARAKVDAMADPRRFMEVFQSALRPRIEKETGAELQPLPIDWKDSAKPMYSNYAAMIAVPHGTAIYQGDNALGAERKEAVFLPLLDEVCTAVIIARNAIATAGHCAQLEPSRIRLGPEADSSDAIELDPSSTVFLKTPTGDQLDMAIVFLKAQIKDLKDSDLPVFASADMIDNAKELLVVGYGGVEADSSNGGVKRLGRIPMLSAECSAIDASAYRCLPGLEIVAGNRAMFDRAKCPDAPVNQSQGACHGDSGGPVYVEGENHQLYLAAIVSSIEKNHCGCADATNLYVRFDKQLGAIRKLKGIEFPPGAFAEVGTQAAR